MCDVPTLTFALLSLLNMQVHMHKMLGLGLQTLLSSATVLSIVGNQAQGMVECLALNSMLTSQARHVRVYMGDLNTTYIFASVKRKLFMTSQGVGNHRVVAVVDWMKSRLSDDAKVARASLATNRLPENMHTGSQCLTAMVSPVTAIAAYPSGNAECITR